MARMLNKQTNPLMKISDVANILSLSNKIETQKLKRKLYNSIPSVSKLYCLPEIRKTDRSIRSIISAVRSPIYNLAKWHSQIYLM